MGFGFGGFGGIGSAFKSISKGLGGIFKKTSKTLLGSDITDAGTDIVKGLGNLVTGGYLSQMEANKIAKQQADKAEDQYKDALKRAAQQQKEIEDIEKRRKLMIAQAGSRVPNTLLGSFLGVSSPANVSRPTLG